MRTLVVAAVIGVLQPLALAAQDAAPGVPPPKAVTPAAPHDGQSGARADPGNADDMGATGWGGSWSVNEGSQNDDAGTPAPEQAKPLPAVPRAPAQ